MKLEVHPATSEHVDFAWTIYAPYVRSNLFSGIDGTPTAADWKESEELKKFQKSWDRSEPFLITVDDEEIGWVSIANSDGHVTIENLFLVPEWRGRKIGSTLIAEMAKEWRSKGTSVSADLLARSETAAAAIRVAEKAGAIRVGSVGDTLSYQLS